MRSFTFSISQFHLVKLSFNLKPSSVSPLRIINWENKGWSKNRAQPIACRNGYRMRIRVNRRDCDRQNAKNVNHEYLDLSRGAFPLTSRPWSPLDLDLERANRLFPLCAMSRVRAICTCCIFRHTRYIRDERRSSSRFSRFRVKTENIFVRIYMYLLFVYLRCNERYCSIERRSFQDSLGFYFLFSFFFFFGRDWNCIWNVILQYSCVVLYR